MRRKFTLMDFLIGKPFPKTKKFKELRELENEIKKTNKN